MNNKIVKNTIFLYIRMLCVILLSLYTSRIVLRELGETDYGIYQTVGGIVAILSFVSTALSTGSSRFLTFELGIKNNEKKLKIMFSSLFYAHFILAVIIFIIGEVIGIWYISCRLNIPQSKVHIALIVYQFSLLISFLGIIQIPFFSDVIAHENMRIYACLCIFEALSKMIIAFSLAHTAFDRLVFYASLLFLNQLIIFIFYAFYCRHKYIESIVHKENFNIDVLLEVMRFSAWSLFSAVSSALIKHGSVLLLTQFFSPALAASRSFADQISDSVNQLVTNFRMASNPQVVKKYASGDNEGSQRLLLDSTRFSYYLMLLIAIPVFFLSKKIIILWLGYTPDYIIIFINWTMIQSLFSVFDSSFYIPLYTKGRLKENAIIAPSIDLLCLIIIYILFKNNCSPRVIGYLYTIMAFTEGVIEKPILICVIAGYKYKEIIKLFIRCFFVTVLSIPIPLFVSLKFDTMINYNFIIVCIISIVSTLFVVGFVGINKNERQNLYIFIKKIWGSLNKNGENNDSY